MKRTLPGCRIVQEATADNGRHEHEHFSPLKGLGYYDLVEEIAEQPEKRNDANDASNTTSKLPSFLLKSVHLRVQTLRLLFDCQFPLCFRVHTLFRVS